MSHRRKTSRDEQRHLEQASVMQEIGRSAAPAMPPQPDVMHISVNQPDDGSASSVSLKVQADAMRRAEEHARQQEQARQQQQAQQQQQQWPAPEHIISHLAQTGAAGPEEVRFLHHRKHMVDSPASLQLLQSAANDAALRGKRKGSPEYLDHVEKTYRQYAQNLGHQPEIHNQPMQTGGVVRAEPEPDVETYPGQHEDERQHQEQQAARVDEIVESELQHEERMKEVANRPDTSRALDLTQRPAADSSYRAPAKEYVSVQAPVSREVPSASGRRQSHGQVKLSGEEVKLAKEIGISVEEYAHQKKRLASMRANNEYPD